MIDTCEKPKQTVVPAGEFLKRRKNKEPGSAAAENEDA